MYRQPLLSVKKWWRIRDLNPGPTDYDSAALTTELIRHELKTCILPLEWEYCQD